MAVRVPPQNLEAEQSILGSLMLDEDAWDQIADIISATDFYKPSHQKLFATITTLKNSQVKSAVDLITVTNELRTSGELEQVGGSEYLLNLVQSTISSANIVAYAGIVREKALLRKMISSSTHLIERAYNEDFESIDSFLDGAEAEFYKLGETKKTEGLTGPMEIVKNAVMKIEDLYKRKSEITGIATGFTDLDRMTAGLQPGELTIIAARPSMGKTAFSLNIAQHVALRQKKTVAYFSLEMSRDAVMMRILGTEARINMGELRTGKIGDSVWPKLIQVAGQVSEAPLFIDETSGISPFEVRARARRLKAQHGLDLIVIDYLQLMDLKQKVESRERAVSEISKTLKAIAKELQIPVIALAQLNRGVEGRADRKPMLSDLRESGSIEQDADVIMMLYREDYYDKENPEVKGSAKVVVAKQRNGATGDVNLRFDAEHGRFRDADRQVSHPLPPPPQPTPIQAGGKPRNFAPGAGPTA